MNLLLYLAGSLAGIGLLVALNLLLMGRSRAELGLDAAKALLATEKPGFCAVRAVLARDRKAALVEDVSGAIHLVVPAGDRLVSRTLSRASVKRLARDGEVLSLRLGDFTFPRARFIFADEAEARDWEDRLKRGLG